MSDISKIAKYDAIRTLGFASVSGSYTGIGSPASFPIRIIKFTNQTNADLYISDDGTTDCDIVPAGGFVLYDFGSNKSNMSGSLDFPRYTRFYARTATGSNPTSGTLYLSIIYAYDNVD